MEQIMLQYKVLLERLSKQPVQLRQEELMSLEWLIICHGTTDTTLLFQLILVQQL
jgi:hypothetical protein